MSRVGLVGKHAKIRAGSPTGFQLRRLPVRPVDRLGLNHSGPLVNSETEGAVHQEPEFLHRQAAHVSYRPSDGDRETSLVRSPSHEAHSVAPKTPLAHSGGPREGDSGSHVTPSSFRLVAGRKKRASGSIFASASARSTSLYRRFKRRLGRSLRRIHCKRHLVRAGKKLHVNFLELKAVSLALKSFEHLCRDQIVLIATHNTTVVSYINKEGGMRSGSLCALLWRILTWCHSRGIVLRARHIPGRLNVIADKLSRHNQVIQTEWSLDRQVFSLLCSKWGVPRVDLFATSFNHKLPRFVSPVLDQKAWAVDALSLSWENLDVYAFSPVSLLNQVVSKMVDQGCLRMILVAPGWPNMPWFWDLVRLSVQVPFQLPLQRDLVTQPFNSVLHRNLSNLNLHASLLEPVPSNNKVSLRKWQQELRLLRESQPEPCISQNGPFLLNGATRMRWTSGRPL